MEEKQDFLGTAPLGKLMRKFAVPCTISLLVGALYNIVDQIFIGWGVGYLGNGATSVVFPLTVLALGLAVMIGDGACSFVSICFGKQNAKDANRAVGNAVTLSVLVGIVVMVLYYIFRDPLLALFGATEANLPYARDYFAWIAAGVPIYVFGQAANPIIRADDGLYAGRCGHERRRRPDCHLCVPRRRGGRGDRDGARAARHGGDERLVSLPPEDLEV